MFDGRELEDDIMPQRRQAELMRDVGVRMTPEDATEGGEQHVVGGEHEFVEDATVAERLVLQEAEQPKQVLDAFRLDRSACSHQRNRAAMRLAITATLQRLVSCKAG